MQPNKQTRIRQMIGEEMVLVNWRKAKRHCKKKVGSHKRFKAMFRRDKKLHPVASKYANWF